jgi:hypothetical protein
VPVMRGEHAWLVRANTMMIMNKHMDFITHSPSGLIVGWIVPLPQFRCSA